MSDFILITDSTADMPDSFYAQHQIPVLSLTYTMRGRTYTQTKVAPCRMQAGRKERDVRGEYG